MLGKATALLLLSFLFVPSPVSAHHSVGVTFNVSNVSEVEGEVTRIRWRNPHVGFTIRVVDDSGRVELWDIETNSVSILRQMGLTPDVLSVGDDVRIAGNPARGGASGMWALNLLLPGAREVLLGPGTKPRWTGETIGTSDTWFASAGAASDPASGIFRVWSTSLSSGLGFWNDSYPLTETARAALASFDPVADNPVRDCIPKGMPTIMEQPYPMEFVERGQTILLRLEEYDTVRTIHLDGNAASAARPSPTPLGISRGRWDGRTLVVTTTGVSWPHFNKTGIPQSDEVEMIERFTPSEDGSRLDYTMTVRDAATFTEPVELTKSWLWLPDVVVEPYECTVTD